MLDSTTTRQPENRARSAPILAARLELAINLDTANTLGLKIPRTAPIRAAQMIE
jgi:hypothetical protein